MNSDYKSISCIHAIDASTRFLDSLQIINSGGYIQIEPDDHSIESSIETVKALSKSSLIVFLGHGHSTGLYSPQTENFERRIIIDSKTGNEIFHDHDILLLSCRSGDFIKYLNTYRNIIGFGNIISSLDEVNIEAEYTGTFRNLSQEDIDSFNSYYVDALTCSLQLLINNQFAFKDLPKWISFFINRKINFVLTQKDNPNRIQLAELLFQFRNEMVFKKRV